MYKEVFRDSEADLFFRTLSFYVHQLTECFICTVSSNIEVHFEVLKMFDGQKFYTK